MNKLFLYLLLVYPVSFGYSQGAPKQLPLNFSIKVTNPVPLSRKDVLVFIPEELLKKNMKNFNTKSFVVLDGNKEIASQYNFKDKDYSGIVTVLSALQANESRTLTIRFNSSGESKRTYVKRTQAELSHKTGGKWVNREYADGQFKNVNYLRVPPEHKDHSWFIRYEGPGWESDKVGYRFYLDQRNATDVFGKTTSEMILQNVGQDGFDSYHNMQPWGMDVLKVGNSLGVGSIGSFYNGRAIRVEKTDSVSCQIVENGDVYSSILTNYYGWQPGNSKHDVQSRISIHAGSRLTHQLLSVSNDPQNICTGLGKDKAAQLLVSKGNNQQWGYLATYGNQSLNQDFLGLAVFFPAKDAIEFTEDQFSHIIKLKPSGGKVEYYFLAAWEKEPGGIISEEEFIKEINEVAVLLANPLKIEILKIKK